ncbi:hypothetical protein [Amycolatopsis sp. YIM 10]|uniref:DUF7144 family membrane protein n=1 Tax=Amycolatopsis sp. YIM 10 TaxID=2653857 RepID=UPI0012A7AFA3|nr:hypothetical protein [Amycolatopsis sp. YIM 10]QFU88942.1 hypothetical protein YIM_18810 [Amycolatopsis sp. YIM 10]
MSEHQHYGAGDVGDVTDVSAEWRLSRAPRRSARHGDGAVRSGWIAFAGAMMVLIGAFNVIEGLAGLLTHDYYLVAPNAVLAFDLTGWAWIHTVIGVLVVLTGAALLGGAVWARVITVVLLIFNAAAQIAFIAVQPLWSLLVIGLCVVVIWAVIVRGGEVDG